MPDFIINRPTSEGLESLLSAHQYDPVGRILRLALWAGLMRKEIVNLRWSDVHLQQGYLEVAQRQVPLSPPLWDYLSRCTGKHLEYVVTSSRNFQGLSPQSASHLMRQALDSQGQTAVRLADLRSEYIIQALQTTPWEDVCQASGMGYGLLRANFTPYLPQKISLSAQTKQLTALDPVTMEPIIAQHPDTAIALAMGLAWYMGVTLQEMVALTWGSVDADANTLTLPNGVVALAPWVGNYLATLTPKAPDTPLLVGPKSGNPLLPERISRLVRQALLANGIPHATLRDLVADYHQRQNGSDAILSYLQTHSKATTSQLAVLLGQPSNLVYKQLQRLCQQQLVVQVGALYYLPGCVVSPQNHQAVVRQYLMEYGRLYRKDVVDLLGITPNQASILLKKWVQAGWLAQDRQSYTLE